MSSKQSNISANWRVVYDGAYYGMFTGIAALALALLLGRLLHVFHPMNPGEYFPAWEYFRWLQCVSEPSGILCWGDHSAKVASVLAVIYFGLAINYSRYPKSKPKERLLFLIGLFCTHEILANIIILFITFIFGVLIGGIQNFNPWR